VDYKLLRGDQEIRQGLLEVLLTPFVMTNINFTEFYIHGSVHRD